MPKIFEVSHPNHRALLIEAESEAEAETLFLNAMGIIATNNRPKVMEATSEQIQQFESDQAEAQKVDEDEAPEGRVLGKAPEREEE